MRTAMNFNDQRILFIFVKVGGCDIPTLNRLIIVARVVCDFVYLAELFVAQQVFVKLSQRLCFIPRRLITYISGTVRSTLRISDSAIIRGTETAHRIWATDIGT